MTTMGSTGPVTPVISAARAALRAPFGRRARAELGFCLAETLAGLGVLAVLIALLVPGTALSVARAVAVTAVLLPVVLASGAARRLGSAHRRLAERLLGERVAPPPPPPPGRGLAGRVGAGLRDGPGWRALAFTVLQLPMAALGLYAAWLWAGGLADLTYPFWWGLFRNHPPGVRLSPVLAATPSPGQTLHVATYPGTLAAFAIGAAMVLAAPWVTRAVVAADRWLLRGLLGPGRLAERVRDLEQTRALAVDDAAALLRQVERDLHDGAQVRLAALAMHLGMAREKLGNDQRPPDVGAARDLVDAAHRGAKDALAELRDLARGIHPPVLDNGLADALATLAAGSAIPVELVTDIPVRPTPAIETIAYFCAAELLANAAKHSQASRIGLRATGRDDWLLLTVTDDGTGGADPAGSGLAGLAQRASTVDGRLEVTSPPGGPTLVAVQLPLRA
jgi:signal transduction histidine kinase